MENLSPVALSCSVRLWKANSLQVISNGEVSSCEASLLVLYEHPNYSTKNIMSSYPVFEKKLQQYCGDKNGSEQQNEENQLQQAILAVANYAVLATFLIFAYLI